MLIETMRQSIIKAYPVSGHWEDKVKAMSDKQVIAVYWQLVKRKKIKGA
jgi:hypothetical protein